MFRGGKRKREQNRGVLVRTLQGLEEDEQERERGTAAVVLVGARDHLLLGEQVYGDATFNRNEDAPPLLVVWPAVLPLVRSERCVMEQESN